ncbi:four helix bundle protein [bacterium CG2_30_37_16]|nr:MAG: four helix bundle protein [bacterium CG2_30_37_16]PIP31196.1 MAG: four helix bundle protein [bacterium (Candidatus Howlettbacteria) CG23_combo_of_CG06-09_8_20_14_all_37_9]PIX99111.1 MAG: four helix bundle protein [bacterium (Candidatus Howlettbacteria) CG_4_10_14_3_um_filter_37_10]PJB06451.1 MAG: four helix bundle protein [bacterium (Candidatus Howlettbacteria) CG_4_9_14_3_um_filter_37_10]
MQIKEVLKTEEKTKNLKVFDLEERTVRFGENVIIFAKKIPKTPINIPIITQVVKSGTSLGANYHETDSAESKKDFVHKMGICKKEAKETKYWFRILQTAISEYPDLVTEAKVYLKEAQEFILIFSAIINKSKIGKEV